MTTLAEFMIVAGAENHPPMLDKTMYNLWESRMFLYIKGKKNGRMMLVSIENGPLVYLTVELLMKGTELTYQERECKLYNEFDKFTSVKGETLYKYYLRFAQLINDMHTIGMTMEQVQESGQVLDKEQLAFLANPGIPDGQVVQITIPHNATFQTDDLDSLNRSMDSDKYLEGQSMQRPPLFESDHFIYWKNRFETYVKAKDFDLWHIILNGDFPPVAKNEVTQILEVVPFEEQSDDLKKKLAKNNEAKMVLYNALPKKEYERIFMCKTAKDIWQSLLIAHQGNSQVKDNKMDLIIQQYEQFTILEEESIDRSFARFNTIITSLKALDEDLSSLALDELIDNLKVHEVVMEKDFEIYRGKKERVKSIALKAKKESSDDGTSTSGSDDEEYAMAVRNFKKFFRRKGKFVRQPREEKKSFQQRDEKKGKSDRKCFRFGDPNHLIGDYPKPHRNKDQKQFIDRFL
ncbi:hypothetical protein Tco_0799673 [Tanacetum coccineum]|uniref:DUF4219 domain-containing protein/UBN2 domain-containing protein n=1 Tax=Tanacetum coccineum TaxID=301880 RepID=A0ABQ4ZRZ1_9ASTR